MSYDNQIEELSNEIKGKGKKVLIQLPEGLKMKMREIADKLNNEGIEAVFSGERCFGACDLKDEEAEMLGCDLLVHIGHNKFYRNIEAEVPVLYFPWKIDIDIENLNNIDMSMLPEKIGLLTTVQHLHEMPKIKQYLEEKGKEAILGGQILGCWTENADKINDNVDAFLFVGSGNFHALAVDKDIFVLDIERKEIRKADRTLTEKRRWARIYNAKNAETFCILVSSKKGQKELQGKTDEIKSDIEKRDKKAFVFIMDEITDDKLKGIKADAFINTACPRILDDEFSKPVINAEDLKEVLELE